MDEVKQNRHFIFWVLVILVVSWVIGSLGIWRGTEARHKHHVAVVEQYGSEAEFLIMGDSKTFGFDFDGLMPFLSKKGIVLSVNSATPVYHLYNFREISKHVPGFKPKVVFISIGPNNFNINGLHCRRDYGLGQMMPLSEVKKLTLDVGEPLAYLEVLLGRLFPVYGHRVQITHFKMSIAKLFRAEEESALQGKNRGWNFFLDTNQYQFPEQTRNAVYDRNYVEIYKRNVLNDYQHSVVVHEALRQLLREVKAAQAIPVIVVLPVTKTMQGLEDQLVGPEFQAKISVLAKEENVDLMYLAESDAEYSFYDINHLTSESAARLAKDHFEQYLTAH